MTAFERKLRAGKARLRHHDPAGALHHFGEALDRSRVENGRQTAHLLYYLGIALARLGDREAAVRSWLSAHRLGRGTPALKMLHRFANSYGMARQSCGELDDWRAFLAIQLARYLNTKRRRRFTSAAERDMVRDLLFDHWRSIKASDVLDGRSAEDKATLFGQMSVVFPFARGPDDHRLIPVDFRAKRRPASGDRCPCGSGLSFLSCCGRLPALEELRTGLF